MLATFKQAITNQLEASLATLKECVEQCPDDQWHEPIVKFKFCHVVFHLLIFADLYLSDDEASFRQQEFHRENAAIFNNYDELSYDSTETINSRDDMLRYLVFCRAKATKVIGQETAASLSADTKILWYSISRAELLICTLRHLQHHVAQLIMKLRKDSDVSIGWIKSGWPAG
jgi:hypothetical protein